LASWWLRRLERQLAAHTDLMFAVSDSCRAELVELGVAAAERIEVLPPAVPIPALLSRPAARQVLGIAPQDRRAVFVGRDAAVKRVEDFAAAIEAAGAWRGDVVGPRVLPPQFAAVARRCERLLVRQPDPEVVSKLAAYDALVLPSRREG